MKRTTKKHEETRRGKAKRFPITSEEFARWLNERGDRRVGTKCHCPIEQAVRVLTGEEFSLLAHLEAGKEIPLWVQTAMAAVDQSLDNLAYGWSRLSGSQALEALADYSLVRAIHSAVR